MAPAPTLYTKAALPRDPSRRGRPVFVGGNLALDFINSTEGHTTPGAVDFLMPGYSNLLDWAAGAGIVTDDEVRRLELASGRNPREAAAIRARAIRLRQALHGIVEAMLEPASPESTHLQALESEIVIAHAARHLAGAQNALRWEWTAPGALDRIVAEVSLAAEMLFTSEQTNALRQCAAPDCERYFLDTSRNGRRRYCTSDGCGTRERVRQFRQRQQTSPKVPAQEPS